MRRKKSLDRRMNLFVNEYVQDFNGARSYIAAGYSENGASAGASRLLANVKIRQAVEALIQKRCDELAISKEKVLRELALLGFSNMRDYLKATPDGELILDFSKLTRDQAAAIQEIREDKTGGTGDGERKQVLRTTFRLADKRASLELLGKHLGMFEEKLHVTGLEGLADRLAEARKSKANAHG